MSAVRALLRVCGEFVLCMFEFTAVLRVSIQVGLFILGLANIKPVWLRIPSIEIVAIRIASRHIAEKRRRNHRYH